MTIKEILNKIKLGHLNIEILPEVMVNTTIAIGVKVYLKIYSNEITLTKAVINKEDIAKAKHELIKEAYKLCSAGMED